MRLAVIGGANVDIGGFPECTLTPGDSTPGRVRISPGGVGRNIAENAARLGLHVELITALGDDIFGRMLLEDCRRAGIGTSHCLVEVGGHSSVYLFIGDGGDMRCAVNDMQIQKKLTPAFLAPLLAQLGEVDAVAVDANLPGESIRYLADELRAPLFADAVSAAKVKRLHAVLPKLHSLKINRIEAEVLTGLRIADAGAAVHAAHRLNEAGVKRVYLTLGAQGSVCSGEDGCHILPYLPCRLVNATGAGDAFAAALLWAYGEGMGLYDSALAGAAASSIALRSRESVSPSMSPDALRSELAVLRQAGIENPHNPTCSP